MRLGISLIVFIACGCATTPPADDFSALYDGRPKTAFVTEFPASSTGEAIARGDHAYRRGELDRALYLYLQAIEADPSRPDAFFRVGTIHEQRGKLELAAYAFRHVLARDPEHAGAHERLGLVLLGQRDLDQARMHLEKAHGLEQDRWKTLNALGVIADLEGEHSQAEVYFRQALSLQPESPRVLTNLGYSLYLANDWAQAEQVLLQALEHASDYELALRNLALLHSRRGNPELSLELLRKVTGEAQAHNDVGYLCLLDGKYALAATYFRRAVELSPSYYELAHRNLERAQALARKTRPNPGPGPDRPRQTTLDRSLFAGATSDSEPAQPRPPSARASANPVSTASAEPASGAGDEHALYLKRWVSAGILNVREGDRADARLLDRLRRGRVVRVLREENGWAYIRYWEYTNDSIAAREGWVHTDYLTDTRQRA